MHSFVGAARPAFRRKLLVIAAAAIVVALAWAGRAFSQTPPPANPGPFVFSNGVMRPDGSIQQMLQHQPPIVYTNSHGSHMMRAAANPGGQSQAGSQPVPYTVLRNGKPWITLTQRNGTVELSDPNGTGQPVVVVPVSSAATTPVQAR